MDVICKAGSDLEYRLPNGKTAGDMARGRGNKAVIDLFAHFEVVSYIHIP